ncbi:hypothetical protein ACCO45_000030 [Purpureocillium lilacinum]|uniref:Uncharacterized protein n=1 Tax=Purpureocillium lilacinum TaxID=33203 RepID=A0ACC4EAU4_PURLI
MLPAELRRGEAYSSPKLRSTQARSYGAGVVLGFSSVPATNLALPDQTYQDLITTRTWSSPLPPSPLLTWLQIVSNAPGMIARTGHSHLEVPDQDESSKVG